jgi:hypothetical protein
MFDLSGFGRNSVNTTRRAEINLPEIVFSYRTNIVARKTVFDFIRNKMRAFGASIVNPAGAARSGRKPEPSFFIQMQIRNQTLGYAARDFRKTPA